MASPDKERINRILVLGGVTLLALLAVYWWAITFELVEEKRRVNISEKVQRNPYLLANQYLETFGIKVNTFRSLMNINDLTADVDTLVLLDLNSDIPARQYEILLEWIRSGGHLILEAEFPWGDFDDEKNSLRLLDEFNVELVGLSDLDDEYEDEALDSGDYEEYEEADQRPVADNNSTAKACGAPDAGWNASGMWNLVQVKMAAGQVAEVVFPAEYILLPQGEEASRDTSLYLGKESYHLVQRKMGAGRISILSDADFLTNPYISSNVKEDESTDEWARISEDLDLSIDEFDHAYFLWQLVGDSLSVWMLYDTDYPTLVSILWKYFPQAMMAFLVLVVSWLWWMNNSFGPLHSELAGSRRSQLEHLHMSARFEWNTDRAEARVRSTRKYLSREFKRKHPRLARLSERAANEALSEIVGLKPQQVDTAIHGAWEKETRYIEITSLIQQIRRKL